jgi:CRISPR/Cas system CSM-associated protein Csm3 (group 7 of RAMP superfamily)
MKPFKKRPRRFDLAEPKPFAYIDLSSKVDRTRYISHEKISDLTGKIELQILVVSDYLFVGSGGYDFRESDKLVYYTFFGSNGNITIPGTSVKGAVRSVAEAISNSCVGQTKRGEKLRFHKPCEFDPEKNRTILCPSCKLFGTTGYSGRAGFSDALLKKGDLEIVKIGELWGPRIAKGSRKFYQNKKFNPVGNLKPEKGYRFVEAVKKGGVFRTALSFQNLTEDELSLLLHAIGINQDYMIKIGGAKPRCFGTVKFQPMEIKILNQGKILNLGEMIEIKDNVWIEEIMKRDGLINRKVFEQFKEAMKPRTETCPKVNY